MDERMASLCGRLTGLSEACATFLNLPRRQAFEQIDETIKKLSAEFNAELASRAKRT